MPAAKEPFIRDSTTKRPSMKRSRVDPGKFVTLSTELAEKAARVFEGWPTFRKISPKSELNC